jgi:hypothetical protein
MPSLLFMLSLLFLTRCIGEGYSHVSSIVPFSTWYTNELSQLLHSRLPAFLGQNQQQGLSVDIIAAVLQVRVVIGGR